MTSKPKYRSNDQRCPYSYLVSVNREAFDEYARIINHTFFIENLADMAEICVKLFAVGHHFRRVGLLVESQRIDYFTLNRIEIMSYYGSSINFFREIERLYKEKIIWEDFSSEPLPVINNLIERAKQRFDSMYRKIMNNTDECNISLKNESYFYQM